MKQLATFTEDGDSDVMGGFRGEYSVAVEGTFGGGTVQFVFLDGEGNELTSNTTDWSFTASPVFPQAWGFPSDTSFIIRLSGSTSPDLAVWAAPIYTKR